SGSGGTAPYSFTIINNALPPNLMLSSAGVISGASTQAGSFPFTVMMTDTRGCTRTKVYTLAITGFPPITLTPPSLPASTSFTFYSQQLTASGGASPYTFTLNGGVLPSGLTLSSSGLLSGAPTATGMFGFTVRATDIGACFGERSYVLTITPN